MSGSQPDLLAEIAFDTDPLSTTPTWTVIANQYIRHAVGVQTARGRSSELSDFQPGSCTITLENRDRRFDPRHAAGPYFGKLKPGKRIRLRATWSAVNYALFDGFIESWPQEYADGNVDATVTLNCFDGLTVLSEFVQPDPVFKYTLSTVGSCALFLRSCDGQTWYDESGFGRHATRVAGPTHSATSFGQRALRGRAKPRTTNTYVGGLGYDLGITTPPAGVNGAASISSSLALGMTSPSVTGGRFALATPLALGTAYSVSFWFQSSSPGAASTPAQGVFILGGNDGGTSLDVYIQPTAIINGVDQGQGVEINLTGPGTAAGRGGTADNTVDGHVHHFLFTTDGATSTTYYDGVLAVSLAGAATSTTLQTIDLDQYVSRTAVPYTYSLLAPPVSTTAVQDITIWTKALSAAEALGVYQRGAGKLPETSAARLSRVIADTDWPSAWVNATTNPKGTCVDYTPAFQGTMDALSEVAATEQGRVFVDAAGVLQLLGRYYQFEVTAGKTSQATFSDDGTGVPYRGIGTDNNVREVQNDITVIATDGWGGSASDSASITAYRRQPTTITTLLPGKDEANDMAAGLLFHRKDAVTRLSQPVTVQPAANTANWPAILGLELGHRVTLKLTPMRNVGSQIVQQMSIEGIDYDITADDWHVALDLAPIPGDAVASTTWLIADDATYGLANTGRAGY